jgi:hypothetical protein
MHTTESNIYGLMPPFYLRTCQNMLHLIDER